MRTTSSALMLVLEKNLSENETSKVHRLSEKYCLFKFSEDQEKNVLIGIEDELGSDIIVVRCNAKHRLPISICLILLKEGYEVRCIDRHDKFNEKVIFDSTVSDFCEFIKDLQNIADNLNTALCLGDDPLRDYIQGPLFVRMRDADCHSKLVGFLTNPGRIFQVTLFDKDLGVDYLKEHIDQRRYRFVIRETVSTSIGRKVNTIYDSFYEKLSSK